jgi:hypothetical protein
VQVEPYFAHFDRQHVQKLEEAHAAHWLEQQQGQRARSAGDGAAAGAAAAAAPPPLMPRPLAPTFPAFASLPGAVLHSRTLFRVQFAVVHNALLDGAKHQVRPQSR